MGKDKNGTFLPPNGRPSGLRNAFAINDLETNNESADKYPEAPNKPSTNVSL